MEFLGWHLPDDDKHFQEMLQNSFDKSRKATYQERQRKRVLKYVKNWDAVYDVGAHIGFWARDFSERFDKVYCFEPCREHVRLLRLNVPSCLICPTAIGNKRQYVSLENHNKNNSGATSVTIGGAEPKELMLTLDYFGECRKERVGLIKIDVEGYELRVLEGAKETLLKDKPIVVFEVKSGYKKYGLTEKAPQKFCEKLGMKKLEQIKSEHIMGW